MPANEKNYGIKGLMRAISIKKNRKNPVPATSAILFVVVNFFFYSAFNSELQKAQRMAFA